MLYLRLHFQHRPRSQCSNIAGWHSGANFLDCFHFLQFLWRGDLGNSKKLEEEQVEVKIILVFFINCSESLESFVLTNFQIKSGAELWCWIMVLHSSVKFWCWFIVLNSVVKFWCWILVLDSGTEFWEWFPLLNSVAGSLVWLDKLTSAMTDRLWHTEVVIHSLLYIGSLMQHEVNLD